VILTTAQPAAPLTVTFRLAGSGVPFNVRSASPTQATS